MTIPNACLNIDFAMSQGYIDPRLTFTRASTGTFIGQNGLIQTAVAGVPRSQYHPTTKECLGLLLESSSTNLCLQSQFGATWSVASGYGTLVANNAVAPDGTTTAAIFTGDGVHTGFTGVTQNLNITNGTQTTVSCWLKAGTTTTACMRDGSAINTLATYTLSGNGSVALANAASATITAYRSGWYRCTATYLSSTDAINMYIQPGTAGAASDKSIYMWGAQVESNGVTIASSYIPTTTVAVTRAADICTLALSTIPGWDTTGCTVLAMYMTDATAITGYEISDGTASQKYTVTSGPNPTISMVGGTTTNISSGVSVTSGTMTKVAAAFANGANLSASCNGFTVQTSVSTASPTGLTTIYIGNANVGGSCINGTFARLAIFPIVVASADLVTLSA